MTAVRRERGPLKASCRKQDEDIRQVVARALVAGPGLVLADEPTAALDKVSGGEVAHLLRDMAKSRGTPILMVTHDPRILDIADRVVSMEDGRIVEAAAA